jgi:hypothetical protein
MVEQQQKRSPVLVTLAALSLASQLAFYGVLLFSTCTGESCGYVLLERIFLFIGTGALLGIAAWLGATFRAVRRHDIISALSIGLLPLVALSNALLVNSHNVTVETASGYLVLLGAWVLFHVATALLLAICLARRQSIQRVIAVAGLVLAVAVLVASSLVD